MEKYYVYIYLDPTKQGEFKYDDLIFENEPFYVGKGFGNRYLHHLNKVKNSNKYKPSLKFSKIEQILSNDIDPIVIKIMENMNEDDSLILEKDTIKKIGRCDLLEGPLTNLNDGGHKPQDNYRHTVETKSKISDAVRKRKPDSRYKLIDPNGIIYDNINLLKFCKENNLNYHKMRKYSNKGVIRKFKHGDNGAKYETSNCHGWEVINNKKEIIKNDIKKILISPTGDVYNIYNDTGILKDLKLDWRILNLYRNKGKIKIRNINQCKKIESKNCDGWEFIDLNKPEHIDEFKSLRKKSWKITSPDGEIFIIDNLLKFCNDNNLSYRTFNTFKNLGVININRVDRRYSDKIRNTMCWMCDQLT